MSVVVQKGIVTIPANQTSVQVTLTEKFFVKPVINASCKENVNIYLLNVTVNDFTLNVSDSPGTDLEVTYVALEKF